MGLDIDQFADFHPNILIEINQEGPAFIEEWQKVILIILKEWRLAIGTLKGIPVQVAPIAMVTDTDIFDEQ
jgi:hypothetical protein